MAAARRAAIAAVLSKATNNAAAAAAAETIATATESSQHINKRAICADSRIHGCEKTKADGTIKPAQINSYEQAMKETSSTQSVPQELSESSRSVSAERDISSNDFTEFIVAAGTLKEETML